MTGPSPEGDPRRFLFDQHGSGPALRQLRARGVDVIHVSEVGLSATDDVDLFLWAKREGRIIVTRNYRDFAPLVAAFSGRGETFPGVLFLPSSIPDHDPGAHVRALETWLEGVRATGENPVQSTLAWLVPAPEAT